MLKTSSGRRFLQDFHFYLFSLFFFNVIFFSSDTRLIIDLSRAIIKMDTSIASLKIPLAASESRARSLSRIGKSRLGRSLVLRSPRAIFSERLFTKPFRKRDSLIHSWPAVARPRDKSFSSRLNDIKRARRDKRSRLPSVRHFH